MADSEVNDDEESFIILGPTSSSFNEKLSNGIDSEKINIQYLLNDVPENVSSAFKAQFQLSKSASPTSLMVASNIITDGSSLPDLQEKFGEILDENVILKETLRQNNSSMKDQMVMITSIQDDLFKTRQIHKDKFMETKEVIERLKAENAHLKQELVKLVDNSDSSLGATKDAPSKSSVYEFVASPDEDTLNKLTEQLELVEKQRRAVIAENDKIQWQKESLETLADGLVKKRDRYKIEVEDLKRISDEKKTDFDKEKSQLEMKIRSLENKVLDFERNGKSYSQESLDKDKTIILLQQKVNSLQDTLKQTQLKIIDLENIKLEYLQMKNVNCEKSNVYRNQMEQLQQRLREVQTLVPQPLKFSMNAATNGIESTAVSENVLLYDQTVRRLAEIFNCIVNDSLANLTKATDLVVQVNQNHDGTDASALKIALEKQHADVLSKIGVVKSSFLTLEKVFHDLQQAQSEHKQDAGNKPSSNENLKALLSDKDEELKAAEQEILRLKNQLRVELKKFEDTEERNNIMSVRLDLYKADFEAERLSREELASERESLLAQIRNAGRVIEELTFQLEVVRRLNPVIHKNATAKRPISESSSGNSVNNMVCPKCNRFSSTEMFVMQHHLDACLDS